MQLLAFLWPFPFVLGVMVPAIGFFTGCFALIGVMVPALGFFTGFFAP